MTKPTFAFISLGCPKNLVDSERMLGKLAQDGYTLQPDADGADVVVVNTCGFIEPARQESLGVIREMLELKKRGRVGAVVVAGCLAERKKDDLLNEVPGVDHIVGVFGREEITQVVDRTLATRTRDEQRSLFRPAPVKAPEDTARLRITPRHYAYLKISEGCDRLCTFCAIPSMRGKHVTKPVAEVVRDALALRTTFIVGFPGETDAEFEELCDFVRDAKFERAGVFPYSLEPGTPASRLPGHLPEEVKAERRDRLMAAQQEVAFAWAASQV